MARCAISPALAMRRVSVNCVKETVVRLSVVYTIKEGGSGLWEKPRNVL